MFADYFFISPVRSFRRVFLQSVLPYVEGITVGRILIYGIIHYACMTLTQGQMNTILHEKVDVVSQNIRTSTSIKEVDITISTHNVMPYAVFEKFENKGECTKNSLRHNSSIEYLLTQPLPYAVLMPFANQMKRMSIRDELNEPSYETLYQSLIIAHSSMVHALSLTLIFQYVPKILGQDTSPILENISTIEDESSHEILLDASLTSQQFLAMVRDDREEPMDNTVLFEDAIPPLPHVTQAPSIQNDVRNFDVIFNKVDITPDHVNRYLTGNESVYDPLSTALVDEVLEKARESARHNRTEYCGEGPTHEFYDDIAAKVKWFKAGRLAALVDKDQGLSREVPHSMALGGDTREIWDMCAHNIQCGKWTPLFAKAYTYLATDKLLDDQMVALGEDSDDRGYLPEYTRHLPFTAGYISQSLDDERLY